MKRAMTAMAQELQTSKCTCNDIRQEEDDEIDSHLRHSQSNVALSLKIPSPTFLDWTS